METPLTPLDFARRARKLYPEREAVIDGDLRLTYAQFLDRCDRWSSALQELGVRRGDRVAYLAPNTHAQLEIWQRSTAFDRRFPVSNTLCARGKTRGLAGLRTAD